MIGAAELRMGNWFQSKESDRFDCIKISEGVWYCRVIGISYRGVNDWEDMGARGYTDYQNISGIPFTKEIALKCGAESTSSYTRFKYDISEDAAMVIDLFDGDCFLINFGETINIKVKIKFVHQLQNFWFAFTGKELEITL